MKFKYQKKKKSDSDETTFNANTLPGDIGFSVQYI